MLRELAAVEWHDAEQGTRVAAEPLLGHRASSKLADADLGVCRGVLCGAVWVRQRLCGLGVLGGRGLPLVQRSAR